jgi:Vacuolar protein sorting-associated protein 62
MSSAQYILLRDCRIWPRYAFHACLVLCPMRPHAAPDWAFNTYYRGKSRLPHGKKWIDVIVDILFPHPIRFREVWKQEGGAKSLYIWKPVPPNSAFGVLGMVATNTDKPPKNDTVRCIPRRWTVPTTVCDQHFMTTSLTAMLYTCSLSYSKLTALNQRRHVYACSRGAGALHCYRVATGR